MSKINPAESTETRCSSCGRSDKEVALIPLRLKGEDKWICAKCLPKLIHG